MEPFDIAAFRAAFPAFADATLYPDATILAWASMANCSLQESCMLNGDCFTLAWQLLTAHIGFLLTRAAAGMMGGVLTSATIDKVTVGFAPPPFRSGWAYWLSQSPYGIQLQGMLSAKAAGGFYFSGTPYAERSAFRVAGGRFVP